MVEKRKRPVWFETARAGARALGCTAFVRRTIWEKPVDLGAAQARDAKQGPPRSEGIVPFPEVAERFREKGEAA
jgi:hypothetical protein